jgi:hypothetical protein
VLRPATLDVRQRRGLLRKKRRRPVSIEEMDMAIAQGASRGAEVIGLDSNVLVRFLTQDDPVQSKKADQLIDKALRSGEPLYLNHVVICPGTIRFADMNPSGRYMMKPTTSRPMGWTTEPSIPSVQ